MTPTEIDLLLLTLSTDQLIAGPDNTVSFDVQAFVQECVESDVPNIPWHQWLPRMYAASTRERAVQKRTAYLLDAIWRANCGKASCTTCAVLRKKPFSHRAWHAYTTKNHQRLSLAHKRIQFAAADALNIVAGSSAKDRRNDAAELCAQVHGETLGGLVEHFDAFLRAGET